MTVKKLVTMKAEKTIYKGTYLKLTERVIGDQVFETAHLRGAVIVFAKNSDGKFLFIKEQRPHENQKVRLKPVTGFIDDGDDWLTTAKKELREEACLIAQNLELIRHIPVSGSIVTDKYFVIATDLTPDPEPISNPDGDVIEELIYLDLEQAIAMTITNEMPLVFDSLGLFLLKELKL
tara:strand:- start:823 stop:1356 length:534 start_codon:yes stop_codon:yes gene_type:complete